jgi:glycerol kinase
VAYQTRDLLDAMQADMGAAWSESGTVIRVDGGMSASDWTMQCLADILAAPVDRPTCLETTALGAAYLAGMAAGLYPDMETFAAGWSAERRFEPSLPPAERDAKYRGWQDAVARTLLRP